MGMHFPARQRIAQTARVSTRGGSPAKIQAAARLAMIALALHSVDHGSVEEDLQSVVEN